MKVLYVLHYAGFGGANIACLRLAQELNSKFGVRPVFLLPKSGPMVDQLMKTGFEYYIIRYASWRGPRSGLLGVLYLFSSCLVNLIAAIKACLVLDVKSITIVHGNTSLTGFAWLFAKIVHKPLVWHQREFGEENYGLKYYCGKFVAGRILGSSDRILTVSDAMRKYYQEFIKPKGRVVTVYDGIVTSGVDKKMTESISAVGHDNEFRVCMIGGISKGKNQIEVVRALKFLDDSGKLSNIHFYILGNGSQSYEKSLREEISRLGLVERIHFLGHKSNVWPYLRQMDCSVCTSLREGFGLAVVEAMYAELPIVAARAGSMPELVAQGETGYLYESGRVDQLADCIYRIKKGELPLDVGVRLRRTVTERFTVEINALSVMRVYQQVLNGYTNV